MIKLLKSKDGSSLISTIVAFAILMMGIAAFTTAVVTSLKVTKEAESVRQDVQESIIEFYQGDMEGEPAIAGSSRVIEFEDQEGKKFSISNSQAFHFYDTETKVSLYYFEQGE
ncbi:hypothetical protein [Ohessyouella blattaphilus]|uniref:Type II secretion system protein n=1 Tax=Ohessyouella blattaphilus TaxID=2949333 RepID=A0ABT1EJU0_9FIRM|nr:hypothetical protein [Ohessyouella blattaphilus]MCP1110958.1 hypothetical protein [Ohessyouella blattaphilus]MCR8564352.1 hypothetical protein [Ohessyouella blattaphilus]